MYEDFIGSPKTMGDVDVLFVEGVYHLFHLVLPNHDFIAHSVSSDGFEWQRVDNAIFIGHPGCWDDSMLWTMHVSRDPDDPRRWRMFYTGLARCDRQLKQRIGMAVSRDLMTWNKAATRWPRNVWRPPSQAPAEEPDNQIVSEAHDPHSPFPIEPAAQHYEASIDEGRKWVSWRDPFFFHSRNHRLLLCSARINSGPLVRRGCVALLEETQAGGFEPRGALFHPGLYDDIEVPNLLEVNEQYYLIGSIREDAKIRYWHARNLHGPWKSYHDNVLLASGNYAARICRDDRGMLIWNFFSQDCNRQSGNVMPPPKRLVCRPDGLLGVVSYEGFDRKVVESCPVNEIEPLQSPGAALHPRAATRLAWRGKALHLENEAGFQVFVFQQDFECFRLRGKITLLGLGKCGLVLRFNRDTHDGYYLSLDLRKGVGQFRSWGTNCDTTGDKMMQFSTLQSAYWYSDQRGQAEIELLAYGAYFEFSIDGQVVLSLVDQAYVEGAVGFYLESAKAAISDLSLERLHSPTHSDDRLMVG